MGAFTSEHFRLRWLAMLESVLRQKSEPSYGFDNIIVPVNHREFHDLCSEDPSVFDKRRVHGIRLEVRETNQPEERVDGDF